MQKFDSFLNKNQNNKYVDVHINLNKTNLKSLLSQISNKVINKDKSVTVYFFDNIIEIIGILKDYDNTVTEAQFNKITKLYDNELEKTISKNIKLTFENIKDEQYIKHLIYLNLDD